jgi:NAD(P)-dependent dehydrogenase (short-subunit alcohol dehydrogenase family)
MSSISGRVTAPLLAPYSMSKFALEAFTDALRRELRPWGIAVACVEPGAIATPIWNKGLEAPENKPENTPPRALELYGDSIRALRGLAVRSRDNAIPAERVAAVVHHALTAKRPKTRYLVGPDARVVGRLVRVLPDRWLDALMRRFTGTRD